MFFAHSKKNAPESEWQTHDAHRIGTSEKCGGFASKFSMGKAGEEVGFWHDFGKCSIEFQKRIRGENIRVDHSTAGAKKIAKRYKIIGKYLAYCIIGHHTGLPDTGSENNSTSFNARINREICDDSDYTTCDESELAPPKKLKDVFSFSFMIRMIFSCLVDADYLDTEEFMSDGQVLRSKFDNIENLSSLFDIYMKKNKFPETPVNTKRKEIFEQCICAANNDKGIYSLTVPTGGGKTLSSLGFALKHAKKHNMNRIIYAIPYTSIIEQNAQVFRNIFKEENVLEHHSNYLFDTLNDENEKKLKLASENWDAPIITTTNVQFFESLFANKPSKCRKLHNISNSVIILDEAQMLPVDFLSPCLRVLEELVQVYNCTIVLCTATQPKINKYFSKDIKIKEIISEPEKLNETFKRVKIEKEGKKSDAELADELLEQNQVLTIVNTKKHAKALYKLISKEDGAYHLSTLMCPVHRKKVLAEIKEHLENTKLVTRVVSTQLIEAGVDIDFPVVYRSAAGLDSIIQSAGRCNRNGLLECGVVKVFQSKEKHAIPMGYLQRTAQIGETIIEKFPDILDIKAIEEYFEKLYKNEELDKNKILKLFEIAPTGEENFQFKTTAKNFKLINSDTSGIIVPYDVRAVALIEKMETSEFPYSCLKKLQPYTINLFENDYNILQSKGALRKVNGVADVLINSSFYNEKEGLIIDKESKAMFYSI